MGWIGVSGPAALVTEAMDRLETICDAYLSVSTPVQVAAPELLKAGGQVRTQIQRRVRKNLRKYSWRSRQQFPSCSALPAEAGWYAVIQVPAITSEEVFVLDLLERTGILAHPGYFFDFEREAFLVISLLPDPVSFSSALQTLFHEIGQHSMIQRARRSGISVPLFSLRSSRSWGIGEIGDIPAAASWLRSANQSVLQILPLNELAPREASPYSALSAMAIDPQFISIWMLEDTTLFENAWATDLEMVRRLPRIDYQKVRVLKNRALKAAFERFFETEWLPETDQGRVFSVVRQPRGMVAR